MQEFEQSTIEVIKTKIRTMLVERYQLEHGNAAGLSPSDYWANFCSYFDYMIDLPERAFAKLRLHTYHLTGDNYQTYIFQNPEPYRVRADALIKDLPARFVINETNDGIGFRYDDGRFISRDILRFQRIIRTLYQYNTLTDLSETSKERRIYILDIGAGYGGLIHHLSNILENTTCVIIDLPETLLFSAAYLSQLNPNKNIYIYDKADFREFINSNEPENYDFVLIPNYHLQFLRFMRFDLVTNVASFQEMETEQVETYLNFINETCSGVLYSLNQDRQSANRQLSSVSKLLESNFYKLVEITEIGTNNVETQKQLAVKHKIKKMLKSMAITIGLLEMSAAKVVPSSSPINPYREYLCWPMNSEV